MKTFSAMMLIFLFIGCTDNATKPQDEVKHKNPVLDVSPAVVSSGNSFGLKLFTKINEAEQNKNVVVSPFSVSMALGMALNGATGATLDSMKQVLEMSNLTMDEINETYKNALTILPQIDPKVLFQIANSAWYNNKFQIKQDFLNICKEYFDAEIASLDFSSPEAVNTINDWVNTKTNGKIPQILDRIPPTAVLYLINAIYFKGIWKYKFDSTQTKDEVFFTLDGSSVPCRMMSQKAKYAYKEINEAEIID